jgi:hypothetical protein
MKLLTKSELEKLTTPRLLAYLKSLRKVHDYQDHDSIFGFRKLTKESKQWQETYNLVKSILTTREHIER